MSLTGRQVAVLVLGIVVAAALAAYALTDPGCAARGGPRGQCIEVHAWGTKYGTGSARWYWLGAAVVALLAIVLALSPWARRKPTT